VRGIIRGIEPENHLVVFNGKTLFEVLFRGARVDHFILLLRLIDQLLFDFVHDVPSPGVYDLVYLSEESEWGFSG
jgi:hypothetical protein